jgi:hypothetical protein
MVISMSLAIVIVAAADLVGSATLVAVNVTVAGVGKTCGAMKIPAEIVPTELLPPGTPAALQVTAVFAVLATTTDSAMVLPSNTELLVGLTVTLTGAGAAVVADAEDVAEVSPHPLPSAARKSNRAAIALSASRCRRTPFGWSKTMPLAKARRGPSALLATREPRPNRILSETAVTHERASG